MTAVITFLVFALTTQAVAFPFIHRHDRRWLLVWMSIAWVCLFALLVTCNLWFPFGGGGDDEDYFGLAATSLDSWSDVFDLTRFVGVEQPGYPWLLSTVGAAIGHDLLALKLVNLACFILLIPIWYRIGLELEGRRFGRIMAVVILLLTPLWHYWVFLLKDIAIVLLQSLFLLGTLMISRSLRLGGWMLVLLTTLAIIPFRSQLVMMHLAVVIAMTALLSIRRGRQHHILGTAVVALVLIAVIIKYASDPAWMASLGIHSEARVIGTSSFVASLQAADQQSSMNRALFPLLYFITETTGFSPATWTDFEPSKLGGVLAIPWIVAVCPFSMFGFAWILRRDPHVARAPALVARSPGLVARLRSSRAIASPWGIVAVFIMIYMVVSWIAGDTTRWRLSDMPAIAAVATAGMLSMAPARRLQILLTWLGVAGGLLLLFYAVRGS